MSYHGRVPRDGVEIFAMVFVFLVFVLSIAWAVIDTAGLLNDMHATVQSSRAKHDIDSSPTPPPPQFNRPR